jgi:hypothetical protein
VEVTKGKPDFGPLAPFDAYPEMHYVKLAEWATLTSPAIDAEPADSDYGASDSL